MNRHLKELIAQKRVRMNGTPYYGDMSEDMGGYGTKAGGKKVKKTVVAKKAAKHHKLSENPWINYVKHYGKQHDISYREALSAASSSYKKLNGGSKKKKVAPKKKKVVSKKKKLMKKAK